MRVHFYLGPVASAKTPYYVRDMQPAEAALLVQGEMVYLACVDRLAFYRIESRQLVMGQPDEMHMDVWLK